MLHERPYVQCSSGLGNLKLFAVLSLMQLGLYVMRHLWWELGEGYRLLTVPNPPVLAYFTNLVADERPGTAAVWHVAGIELVNMTLVQFITQ